jgi:transcriptional regulator with XRE-family HTH domain
MQRLAEIAGLSTSIVSLIERDQRTPSLDTLFRLADALGMRLGPLITRAEGLHEAEVK